MLRLTRSQFLSLLFILGLLIALFTALNLVGQKQEIRKKAAATSATLALYPTSETFCQGEAKAVELKATFLEGSASEKLDYFKTEINFSKDYLSMPDNVYIDTSTSGFGKILRVDGSIPVNETGKIIIELAADVPGNGPATDQPITIAKIILAGKAATPSTQQISINADTLQMINNQASKLPVNVTGASYTVGSGDCILSPTPTGAIAPPSLTPTPTGIMSADVYTRFGIKLFGVETTPDILVWLKVRDLVVHITPPPIPIIDTCQNAGAGEYLYKEIPMTADENGVYHPKAGGTFKYKDKILIVTDDGWLPLLDVAADRAYALYVKGPKHRKSRMIDSIQLMEGKDTAQNFDWSSLPLDPGDLPNPDNSMLQDCTINSVDISLITARINSCCNTICDRSYTSDCTDWNNLEVADVNYDGVINSTDISRVVYTLSTKPDDDD
jgi:hypothetical protein